MTLTPTQR